MKVLICEDEVKIRKGLVEILQTEGYETFEASDGDEAIKIFREYSPDFICLDIMLPKVSGYDVCRAIRRENADIPIMFITARTQEIDRVIGLELGADDYVVKPFGVNEVISRIRAITRRCYRQKTSFVDGKEEVFEIERFIIYPSELVARSDEKEVELSLREVKILQLLQQEEGKIVTRDFMFDTCWGMNYLPNSRTLDQQISKLRKKIEDDPKNPKIIETVHGVGYRYRKRRSASI